jgi:hypothetical protein
MHFFFTLKHAQKKINIYIIYIYIICLLFREVDKYIYIHTYTFFFSVFIKNGGEKKKSDKAQKIVSVR